MLWAAAAATFVVWIVLFVLFHTARNLVHGVLVLAAAAALYDLIADRQHRT
jgi:hypothetical protein